MLLLLPPSGPALTRVGHQPQLVSQQLGLEGAVRQRGIEASDHALKLLLVAVHLRQYGVRCGHYPLVVDM